jgi:mRNA interferase RelE/StbE
VKVKFEARFEKDIYSIKDAKILSKLKKIIIECKEAQDLSEIRNLKKMQGYATFYRIRIGDYRVGIEFTNNELIFTRFLHGKDIYKFFP